MMISYVRYLPTWLLLAGTLATSAVANPLSPSPQSPSTDPCRWLGASGEELLARSVSNFSITEAAMATAIADLSEKANLPLSFIQGDVKEERLSLEMRDATVHQILDELVARASSYRYSLIADRVVLYPRDPKWDTHLENMRLGPAPRVRVAGALAKELSQRLPAFAGLVGPWILGDPGAYTYQDEVSVVGPGSVVELLVQLLGKRPSTFLLLVKKEGARVQSLSVNSRDQLQALKLTAPTTSLQRRDEAVQLRLVGTLKYGGLSVDLTLGECGTVYEVSDRRVLEVSADGLVTARGRGEARIRATVERFTDMVIFKADLPEDIP